MRGEATVGDYRLVFDFNALCLAEEHTGPLGAAMENMGAGSLKAIRALFWAGLQRNHEMSIEDAGQVVQEIGVDEVSAAIAKGIESAFSKTPKSQKGNRKAAQS